MRSGLESTKSVFWAGAHQGALLWSFFAVIECLFYTVLTWVFTSASSYSQLNWRFTALLLVLYPVFGFLAGGLFFVAIAKSRSVLPFLRGSDLESLLPLSGTLLFILVYSAGVLANFRSSVFATLGSSEIPSVAIVGFSVAAIFVTIAWPRWRAALASLTHAGTLVMVLLGLPWINETMLSGSGFISKAAGAMAYALSVLVLSHLIRRRAYSRDSSVETQGNFSPLTQGTALVLASVALLGASFFLRQMPIDERPGSVAPMTGATVPNVIFVVLDTVRADHLSLYGYQRDTSPHLEEFAQNATLYSHAIAPSDLTLSTHASFFTGVYATEHGAHTDYNHSVMGWGQPLPDRFDTLAEVLERNQYSTLAVISNYGYLSPFFGLHQGFQYYDLRLPVPFLGHTRHYYLRQSVRSLFAQFAHPRTYDTLYRSAEEINDATFGLLQEAKDGHQPFFLFLNYMDAHWPYYPPPPYDTRWPGKRSDLLTTADRTRVAEEILRLDRPISESERDHFLSQYDGALAYLDAQLGMLLERLRELDLYENSLLIITSDHGEAFGERNMVDHGVSVYQDQVYAPLIVKYPHVDVGKIEDSVVSLVDIFPTVLDVVLNEIPVGVPGHSLLRLETDRQTPVVAESFPNSSLLEDHPRFHRTSRAIFDWPYKFISTTATERELYSLAVAFSEGEDLIEREGALALDLEARLDSWLVETLAKSVDDPLLNMDKETLDRLRSLGYIK